MSVGGRHFTQTIEAVHPANHEPAFNLTGKFYPVSCAATSLIVDLSQRCAAL